MKREDVKNKIPGITDEQLNWIMQENGADINREKSAATALQTQLDNANAQLKTAQDGLKAFDGVDVAGLQEQVTKLKADMKAQAEGFAFDADAGTTTYLDLDIDNDEAVNEIIDGFDAASVPDGITAERLDSAGYSMALSIDKKSIEALQGAAGANISATKTACTASTAYKEALAAKRTLSRNGVPQAGRWMIVSPEYLETLMQDDRFIKQGDLSQQLVQTGAVGQIAGFAVYESNNMDFENTTRVASKKTTTEFICGHPNWCHRVMEWQTPVHLQDLGGSGKYIGASAVQGRKVYGIKVSKPKTLYIKRIEA